MVPETMTGQRRAALLEQRLQREDRRLGVQGVEDRLDQQHVRAAVDQAAGLAAVGLDELVEGDVAGARVVHVGRDRRRLAGRAQRPDDVPRLVRGARGHLVARLAGEPGRGHVELVGELLHAVVGEGDRRGVEGVRRDQVGAGVEVLAVDRGDQVRRGDAEQVVVALHVGRPVGEPLTAVARLVRPVPLDRRAHGAVEDEDALLEERSQLRRGVRARSGRHRARVDVRADRIVPRGEWWTTPKGSQDARFSRWIDVGSQR